MSIKHLLKEVKLPKSIDLVSQNQDQYTGVFEVEPFDRGFGTSIGNLFRRVLLSSIQGYAVTAIRVNTGKRFLTSEYESIDGVLEDSIDIIERIKDLKLVLADDSLFVTLSGKFKGVGECTATIFENPLVTILNSDIVLFKATEEVDIEFELEVELGRGYIPSEITKKIEN